MTDVTFVFLASPQDLPFADLILRHLLKMCAFPFQEVIVIADDLPKLKMSLPSEPSFTLWLQDLIRTKTISRYIPLSTLSSQKMGSKYFGSVLKNNRDHREVPLFGWIAGLEASETDLVVHFDSDILLYQSPGQSWIREGCAMLTQDETLMFVSPLPGPPNSDATFPAQTVPFTLDSRGNLHLKGFSSRGYLVSKARFDNLLPTSLVRLPGRGNLIGSWECSVDYSLNRSIFHRAHLRIGGAWYLHCPDHGNEWICALPDIINRVESNCFPPEQGGHYDLLLNLWKQDDSASLNLG